MCMFTWRHPSAFKTQTTASHLGVYLDIQPSKSVAEIARSGSGCSACPIALVQTEPSGGCGRRGKPRLPPANGCPANDCVSIADQIKPIEESVQSAHLIASICWERLAVPSCHPCCLVYLAPLPATRLVRKI
ncbi:hypothetical protein GQ54DRAFT_173495 [Martensiomyces pterosporus]|nr:hypothetical protein GQ54DRAFT_173495 [Martensiomyces pterosporus]